MTEFTPFMKIPRLSRICTITEKLDGTNASVVIGEDGSIRAGSRERWIYPNTMGQQLDNFGFAAWVQENKNDLMQLGVGQHFGEWWGHGIQRGYGLPKGDRRFSLFNTKRWSDMEAKRPLCCNVVPVLFEGIFDTIEASRAIEILSEGGSFAAPGFMKPEGIIIYHHAANMCFKKTFKKTIEKDEEHKGKSK